MIQLKKDHEDELREQKEEYGKLLRDESSKWKLQREELESEISQFKRIKTTTNSQSYKSRNDPDLTAIIKDLKENSSLLNNNSNTRTDTRKRTGYNTSTNLSSNNTTSSIPTNTRNVRSPNTEDNY